MNHLAHIGRTKAPCRGCEDRVAGCHATCERFKEYEKIHAEEKTKIYEEKRRVTHYSVMYRSNKEFAAAGNKSKNKVFKQSLK